MVPRVEEENLTKTNFWERLYDRKEYQTTTETVTLRSLVKENYIKFISLYLLFIFQFRYTTFVDLIYITLAIIASIVGGLCTPLYLVVFGYSIDSFTNRATVLCSANFTSLPHIYCPPEITLTSNKFQTLMT